MVARLSPDLPIIDSLSSISSRGENHVEDVRLVLSFLNAIAQDFRVGLILIHHLKKGSAFQERTWDLTIDDFRSSSHIIAMSRSVMGLSLVQTEAGQDRNGPRRLEIIKTNLGLTPTRWASSWPPCSRTGLPEMGPSSKSLPGALPDRPL